MTCKINIVVNLPQDNTKSIIFLLLLPSLDETCLSLFYFFHSWGLRGKGSVDATQTAHQARPPSPSGPGMKRCPGRVSSQAGKEFWQGAQDTWHLLFPLSTAAKNTNSKLALRASESSVCAQEGGIRVGFLRKELWSPLLHSSE